jgi:hypothetical protein
LALLLCRSGRQTAGVDLADDGGGDQGGAAFGRSAASAAQAPIRRPACDATRQNRRDDKWAKGPTYPSLGRSPRTGVIMVRGLKARAILLRVADTRLGFAWLMGRAFSPVVSRPFS